MTRAGKPMAFDVKSPHQSMVSQDGESTLQPTPPLQALGIFSGESILISHPPHWWCEDQEKCNEATRECPLFMVTMNFDEAHICKAFHENTYLFNQRILSTYCTNPRTRLSLHPPCPTSLASSSVQLTTYPGSLPTRLLRSHHYPYSACIVPSPSLSSPPCQHLNKSLVLKSNYKKNPPSISLSSPQLFLSCSLLPTFSRIVYISHCLFH